MNGMLTDREARRLLGWGVKTASVAGNVEQAQDILWQDGDLAIEAGLQTLRQDLAAALVTARGSDPLNPGFGFDGFDTIAEEADRFLLRERLRVSVVNMLKRDTRVDRIDQVLIGRAEIEAARSGQTTAGPPAEFGIVDIEVGFRLRGRPERLRLDIGSILGSS
jgi:hypothetical protein